MVDAVGSDAVPGAVGVEAKRVVACQFVDVDRHVAGIAANRRTNPPQQPASDPADVRHDRDVRCELQVGAECEQCRGCLDPERGRQTPITLRCRGTVRGMERIGHERPEVVLTDLMMPNLDGWELCRLLRRRSETRSIPIIAMSALDVIEAQADAFLHKPFELDHLLNTLTRVGAAWTDSGRNGSTVDTSVSGC